MNLTTTLTTFRYDPYSQEARRDPTQFYPSLREEHPHYFIPEYDAYVLTRYEDVWNAFMDMENFTEAEGQLFSRDALLVNRRSNPPSHQLDPVAMFNFLDPPVHNKLRRGMAMPFAKGSIARLEPEITQLVRDRLAKVVPTGYFDLNGDLGSYVSVGATALVMGLPISDTARIIELVNTMVARRVDRAGPTEEGTAARLELMDFLVSTVAARRAGKGIESRLIDSLIGGEFVDRPQTDTEIATHLLGILVGGTETVPKVFAGAMLELSRRPDQLAAVRADLAANVPPAFEEALRFCAPAQWFGRTAKHACEVAGLSLEPGQRVILIIAAANRDPREFEDPDAFIWNRKARRMLSFGVGPHFCIGIHLARLEGQILLRETLAAVGDYEIDIENGEWPISEFQLGWVKLPIRLL